MKNIRLFLALALALLLLCPAMAEETDPAAAYEAAMALYEAENFEEAIPAFEALGNYKDSQKMLANSKWYWKEQRYDNAVALYKAESFLEAQALFEELGSFEESKKYAAKCVSGYEKQTYQRANDLFAAGDLTAARELFISLGDYQKSESLLVQIDAAFAAQQQAAYEQECYEQAMQLKAEGKLAQARDKFVEAGDLHDSTDQLYEVLETLALDEVYEFALLDVQYGRLEDALVRFETLGDHRDSAQQAASLRETITHSRYEEAGRTEDASRAFLIYLALGDYLDSAAKAEALQPETGIITLFNASETLRREGRFAEAAKGYALCENYKDSRSLADEMTENAENSVQFERAHILTDLWRLEEANAIYKSLGSYSYAKRMGIERISAGQLRDDATSPVSETFIAPDGTAHRYRMYKGVPRWVEAEAFCRALGGHLATMTSEEENRFVHSFMWNGGFTTAYFGLEDEERDHTWEWVSGEPVEYTNWDSGEPSYSGRERYGMYFYKHTTGTWNDAHFYEDAEVDPGCSFICEWDVE